MKPSLNLTLLATVLAVGGCDREDKREPTGQVVATVAGAEITLEDLRAEAGVLAGSTDPSTRKAAEQAALRQIVGRTIVANRAREQKLDQTPLAAILRRRAEQEALVLLVQRKLIAEVPQPSREEVELFISDHPSSFAKRRIFVVDQIIASGVPPEIVRQLEQTTTLAHVRQIFTKSRINYNQTIGTIDALAIDADAAEKLASLPVGAMFISPELDLTRVNLIRDVASAPVSSADATRLAREAIRSRRADSLTQRQLDAIVGQGMADVRYNAAFKPAAPAAGAAKQ